MKHRIKKFASLIIAVSMLLSLIPLTSAALDDEFEGMETLEEIPFTFELEPGDLPFEQLKDAVLAASDIPSRASSPRFTSCAEDAETLSEKNTPPSAR